MDFVLTVILVVIMTVIIVGLVSRHASLVVAETNLPDQLYRLPARLLDFVAFYVFLINVYPLH